MVRQTFKNFRKYRIIESNDSSTSVTLTENMGTTIQRGLEATRSTKFTESDIQRANKIITGIQNGTITVDEYFKTATMMLYLTNKISATIFLADYDYRFEFFKTIVTTQKEEPGSSQGKEDPPVIVINGAEDRPEILEELAALPVKREITFNKVIAGLFMSGIALAFMGSMKKRKKNER